MSETLTDPSEISARDAFEARLDDIGRMHGFHERLGRSHRALHVHEGEEVLLVTFDRVERCLKPGSGGLPLGFNSVETREYSLLSILSEGQGWFRDAALYAFFDRLIDDDFFEGFDKVIFLGAGPQCAYAAASYSVSAPGAQVIAISPVATLEREAVPFELRFRRVWRKNFSDRFGFAPAMIEGSAHTAVIYDPMETLDAAHAALFRGPNVSRLPLRGAGSDILGMLRSGEGYEKLLSAAEAGHLDAASFAPIARQMRRTSPAYLRRLYEICLQSDRPKLAEIVARAGLETSDRRHFERRLSALETD